MSHIEHLSRDKRLKKAMTAVGPVELRGSNDLMNDLFASIISQQLSTKVARVIHSRFLDLYSGKKPTAEQVLASSLEVLRSIGLSLAKAQYMHNVARFFIEKGLSNKQIRKMNDEAVIHLLTQIKGVGRWTVEMLLMFSLKREDVFAVDDLGIQQGMISLYKLEKEPKKKLKEDMQRIAAKWSPYRTYACLYLWRWKDGV